MVIEFQSRAANRWTRGLAAALALAACTRAGAVVLRASKDNPTAQELLALEEAAHEEGLKLKCPAGIVARWAKESEGSRIFSGVFLGASEDEAMGYVLTAAHPFFTGGRLRTPEEFKSIQVVFGPSLFGEGSVKVPARQVALHPKAKVDTSQSYGPVANDLAILEFDFKDKKSALAELGVQPATLYSGTGYLTAPRLEAKLAGYGICGLSDGTCLNMAREQRLHAGLTYCVYQKVMDHNAFVIWLPLPLSLDESREMAGKIENYFKFSTLKEEGCFVGSGFGLKVKTHPEQARPFLGDSGGPLFFESMGEMVVAGICSATTRGLLVDIRTWEAVTFSRDAYTPIPDHLEWINGILKKGCKGSTQLLAFSESKGNSTEETGP